MIKTPINKLIQIMKNMLQEIISHEGSQAKYYSIHCNLRNWPVPEASKIGLGLVKIPKPGIRLAGVFFV